MTEYTEVPNEVITIAQELVETRHDHLVTASIGFIFRKEAQQSRGKQVWCSVRKPPAWHKGLVKNNPDFEELEYDFVVEIAEDIFADLTSERRKALVDYALCHCGRSKNGNWRINPPDVEGFNRNIQEYGFWNAELLSAAHSFREIQESLPGIEMGTPGNLRKVDPLKFEAAALDPEGWDEADKELMDRHPEITEAIQGHAEQQNHVTAEEEPV